MRIAVRQFEADNSNGKTLPDVVLIHGTGADGTLWEPQVKLLTASGHRCFVPELRGHGLTHEPQEWTGIEVHVEDLLETLECCQIRYPAIWVGHSLGAIILLQMSQAHPELFVQILAVGLPGKVPPMITLIFRWFLCSPFELVRGTIFHKKLPLRHRILIDTERHSLQQIVEHFATINLVDKEHKIPCPVHLSVGRFDVVAPYFYAEKIHQLIPGSTLRIFEFAGHSCMDDQPDQFNEWLAEKIQNGSITDGDC